MPGGLLLQHQSAYCLYLEHVLIALYLEHVCSQPTSLCTLRTCGFMRTNLILLLQMYCCVSTVAYTFIRFHCSQLSTVI